MNPYDLKLGMQVWVVIRGDVPDGFVTKIEQDYIYVSYRSGHEIKFPTTVVGAWANGTQ